LTLSKIEQRNNCCLLVLSGVFVDDGLSTSQIFFVELELDGGVVLRSIAVLDGKEDVRSRVRSSQLN
jgi:hypothetical protein